MSSVVLRNRRAPTAGSLWDRTGRQGRGCRAGHLTSNSSSSLSRGPGQCGGHVSGSQVVRWACHWVLGGGVGGVIMSVGPGQTGSKSVRRACHWVLGRQGPSQCGGHIIGSCSVRWACHWVPGRLGHGQCGGHVTGSEWWGGHVSGSQADWVPGGAVGMSVGSMWCGGHRNPCSASRVPRSCWREGEQSGCEPA